MKLKNDFYARPADAVARDLLGALVVRRFDDGRVETGRIVETEAYVGPQDLASHSRFGKTTRNAAMFGPPGRAYVFLVYGMHCCLNVVAVPGAAVLLRALEPLGGSPDAMRGPGKLCSALGIDRTFNHESFRGRRLWIEEGPATAERVKVTPRIGVDYAGRWAARKLRYCLAGNPAVSGPKALR